jgi:hypothetical protein
MAIDTPWDNERDQPLSVTRSQREAPPTSNQWVSPNAGFPNRNEPVLCAWKCGNIWRYGIAKFTGKRWLDVIPETVNEEYVPPNYWQKLIPPDSPVETSCRYCAADLPVEVEPDGRFHITGTGKHRCAAEKAPAPRRVESILDFKVTVCSECLQASCWAGEFYCEQHREASTVTKTVRELHALGPLENPSWWFKSADSGKVNQRFLEAYQSAVKTSREPGYMGDINGPGCDPDVP